MSAKITTAPGSVAPGEIAFYDRVTPPLAAGSYTLRVRQDITGLNQGPVAPYTSQQAFQVDAPRFRIDPALIHMVFPPAGEAGAYHDVVPSMVFKDFALPWMRPLNPQGGDNPDGPPWMALLTIHETEMPVAPGQPQPPEVTPRLTFPATITAGDLTHPKDPKVLPPVLPGVPADDPQQVLACDMDLAFFRQIAPALGELEYLAHARDVNTDGKTLLGMELDGCFSVVTGNRMPGEGGTNTVLLVSLEGHQDHLPGGGALPGYDRVRLVVLGRWQFLADVMPGSFLSLLEQLCLPGRGGVHLLQPVASIDPAAPPADRDAPTDPMAAEALAIGYLALQNDLRDGEVTTSFYRGPLVPQPTALDSQYGPYVVSDQAMLYDPDYGMFNTAYAAAWQVGRLLALSSGSFTQAAVAWRRSYAAQAQAAHARATVETPLAIGLGGMKTRLLAEEHGPPVHGAPPLEAAMRDYFAQRLRGLDLPVMIPRGQAPLPAPSSPLDDSALKAAGDASPPTVDALTALRRRLTGET